MARLSSTKAQITKVERAIVAYIDFQKANNLFFDEQVDEVLNKAYLKLEQKKQNLYNLQQEVEKEVQNARKPSANPPLVS